MSISTFFGIEMGRRALATFRRMMDNTGHNVSNVNTPGYHRQRTIVTATDPYAMPSINQTIGAYQVGTGVDVSAVQRLVNNNIENRLRSLMSDQEYETVSAQFLTQLESIEAIQSGVLDRINSFFAAWQDLADNPELTTVRSIVIQKGISLSIGINQAVKMVKDLRTDANSTVQQTITDVNTLLQEICDYNVLVRKVASAGDNPNDLQDHRDNLVNELSKYVDIQVEENPVNKSINVYIGGRVVVQDDEYLTLSCVVNPLNSNFVDVRYSDDLAGANVILGSGQLKAMLDVRDSTTNGLLYYKQQLDSLATDFINGINAQHAAGFDLTGAAGGLFFDVPDPLEPAENMQVNALILDPLNGPGRVAAASIAAGFPGDGSNALTIAQLQRSAIIGGTYTPSDFIANYLSNLGANIKTVKERLESVSDLVDQIQGIRDEVSGVSLDEEAANLLEYEKAYQAAAKIITVYDEMYDVLLNIMR